jgi:hypothetical protein
VVSDAWAYVQEHPEAQLLAFDTETGKHVDFDLRGTRDEALARVLPPERKRGPGRPRLGVVCSEVCLLPRHWDWLERQPRSASATLRRLVDAARKSETAEDRARESIDTAARFMWDMAGDFEGFEEATRALYARKWGVFHRLITPWPEDVKKQIDELTAPARTFDTGDETGGRIPSSS